MKTCIICGDPVPIFPNNRLTCSDNCSRIRMNERNRNLYRLDKKKNYKQDAYNDRSCRNRPRNKFYCYVRQPGMADYDGWHRVDYDRYKKELPAGTEVRFNP